MTIRKILIFLFFTLITLKGFTQNDSVTYYFDPNFKIITPDSATYLAIGKKEIANNSLWKGLIVNIVTKNTIIDGHYNDSLFSVPVGMFYIFSDDGKKQEEGSYTNGKKHGVWFTWDDDGNLIDSAYYENGEGIFRTSYNFNNNGKLLSAVHEDKNLNISIRLEYDSGQIVRQVINNLNDKIFETKLYYNNGQLKADMLQKKGKTNSKFYDEKGSELTKKEFDNLNKINSIKIFQPEFPGGINAFMRYIYEALKRNKMLSYESGKNNCY